MRKIYFLLLLSLFATGLRTIAQQSEMIKNKPNNEAARWLQKSKNQKVAAWVLAGSGTALIIAGISAGNSVDNFLNPGALAAGGLLLIVGSAAVISSIPFFIASHRNHLKAGLLLKTGTLRYRMQTEPGNQQVYLGLKLGL